MNSVVIEGVVFHVRDDKAIVISTELGRFTVDLPDGWSLGLKKEWRVRVVGRLKNDNGRISIMATEMNILSIDSCAP